MCGIFGYIPPQATVASQLRDLALALQKKLTHRGPDDAGFAIFPASADQSIFTKNNDSSKETFCNLLLGHTRLAIIDLSPAGHQPMLSADKRFCLAYNGEVYNYKELRAELQADGCRFHTKTDTELVLQALIHWGLGSLRRFVGMFALALYDRKKQRLFCARDGFGIKPFYWSSAHGFAFASEIPALLQFPAIPRNLDEAATAAYLDSGIVNCGPNTLLADVNALPAGHYMEIDTISGIIKTYARWWLPPVSEPRHIHFEDAAEELRNLFLDSVRLHLRSDVPLGVALSGGIDSSAVACCVRRLEPDFPIHTFSYIAADSKKYCEEGWVDIVNAHVGAIPHKVLVGAHELPDDIDRLILAQGEPFGSTSIYAQFRVFQAAAKAGIKVMMEGQGADELLAGYYGYPQDLFRSFMDQRRLAAAVKMLRYRKEWPTPFSIQDMFRAYITHKLPPAWKKYIKQALRCQSSHTKNIVHQEPATLCPALPSSKDALRTKLASELCWFGLPGLLRHGDRNAMAFSIENRVPFCTIPLAEFCLSLPPEYLVSADGETKKVFRAAMRGIVPDAILNRRDKIGFATPELSWQKTMGSWFIQLFNSTEKTCGAHAAAQLSRMLSGKQAFDWRVWRFANFILWEKLLLNNM